VSHHFGAALVRPLEETPDRSVYLVPACDLTATNACRIEFCVGGEARAPVALASMTAKYVRELAMHAFNTFWSSRLPGLRPTAGYPSDALRWRHDAAAAIEQEQLAEAALWRRA
jgi:pyruvate/2-oxoglutarate/acetoin dehydrogenase E1 component